MDVAAKAAEKASPAVADQVWQPVARLRDEMARMFNDFFSGHTPFFGRGFDVEPLRRSESMFGGTVPAFDLVDQDKQYRITAELPGMDENDIDVSLANHVLTVKGDKKEEVEEKKAGYFLSERRFGMFQRSFRLPDDIDLDKIGAHFQKGVLTISLPKATGEVTKKKKISVETK